LKWVNPQSTVFIKPDLTPMQLQEMLNLKKEMERRIQNGENIMIKNNKIVSKSGRFSGIYRHNSQYGSTLTNQNKSVLKLPIILLTNIRSLTKKFDDLLTHIDLFKIDLCCVTETWLQNEVPDNFLEIRNFSFFRQDRKIRKGGGVCMWIRTLYDPVQVIPLNKLECNVECIFINLAKINTLMILLYATPSLKVASKRLTFNHIVDTSDSFLIIHPLHNIIVAGDFDNLDCSSLESDLNLRNIVKDCTRKRSILDLILMDNRLNYECVVRAPIAGSDHNTIVAKPISASANKNVETAYQVRDMRKSNLTTLCLI
jgi:hypothetical protein